MRVFSFIFLYFLLVIHTNAQSRIVKSIDSVCTSLYNSQRFNGTVLYAVKGQILLKKAYGITDIRTNEALKTSSAFNLASVSKQFVTMCVMILQERGQLHVDNDVRKYIPDFPYQNITIRHLMHHTSGLPEYFDLFINNKQPLDTLNNEKLIQLLVQYKPELEFPTGSKWNYNNTGYILLASIIERVSGKNLHEFVHQNISKPLGLMNTYVYNIEMPTSPPNRVYGFSESNGKQLSNDLMSADGVVGDGNFYSSVEDLFIWEQSLYSTRLVNRSSMDQIFKPVQLTDGTTYPYGFGWGIDSVGVQYAHTGSWVGFRNLIVRDVKSNRTLIILSSGDNGLARQITKNIFEGKAYNVPVTYLIKNVQLIDGLGSPARVTSVRVEGDKILALGDLKPFIGEKVINGEGKVLSPGFIDTHSHVVGSLRNNPEAIAALNQGVTTIISGQDGYGEPIDNLKSGMESIPVSVNVGTYTGHTWLRDKVMGSEELNRTPTKEEIEKMKSLLDAEMTKGSLGISTGLEYEGAFYSNTNEVIELAKVAASHKGRYISHMRSEDINLNEAIDEIITIGHEAKIPVQISHFKIALKDSWGSANTIISKLQKARLSGINITADCYPYDYWSSTIRVLFPQKMFKSLDASNYAIDHLFDPVKSVMVRYAPDSSYVGKTVAEISDKRKESMAKTLLYLIDAAEVYEKANPEANGIEAIMGKSMVDDDIISIMSWGHTNICSDGSNGGHPRGYGAFTRFLSYYVREKQIMNLETAIQRMTSLAAENIGLKNRGVIAPGYFADLVLFDPTTVRDNSTIKNSKALSDGILKVWVNGELVFQDKQSTKKYPGKFVSK